DAKLKDFRAVPSTVPSATFARAAEIWSTVPTDTKEQPIGLPTATAKFVGGDVALMDKPDKGKQLGTLPMKTRVQAMGQGDPDHHKDWSRVVVVDGSLAGQLGWVKTAVLSEFERKKKGR